ncbi:phosphotransferase [Streptomyces sp. NPDC047315]|uniref:phosphotransferase n=1 Tax=Streptomyces sp. NPDC047315 TaxID=3155142 RepID=UPI0033F9FF0B
MLRHPGRAGDLLTAVVNELAALNDLPEAKPLIREAGTPKYLVTNAFARSFPQDAMEGAPAPLGDLLEVVGRLRPLVQGHTPAGDDVVVYGDLTPEHIVATGSAGRPTFLDPALSIGPVVLDVARLVSRLALQVMAVRHRHARRIFTSVHQAAVLLARRHEHPTDWLRSLALLWAADTVTYLHTCRTTPMVLPQPYQAEAILSIEPAVLAMLDRSVRALAVSDGAKVWNLTVDSAIRAAGQ